MILRQLCTFAVFAALAPFASAFLMLDDFTAGSHQATVQWPDNSDEAFFGNLDLEHCAFGDRFYALTIRANPAHVPVHVTLGGGVMSIRTDPGQNAGLSTEHVLTYGVGNILVDLSRETEIWADLEVRKPNGRFADLWSVTVQDTNGVTATNDGWLFRQGGIRFRKQGFTAQPDWSNITYMTFTQWFNSQGAPHPESYTLTRLYAVPEPCTLAGTGFLLFVSLRRLRRPS